MFFGVKTYKELCSTLSADSANSKKSGHNDRGSKKDWDFTLRRQNPIRQRCGKTEKQSIEIEAFCFELNVKRQWDLLKQSFIPDRSGHSGFRFPLSVENRVSRFENDSITRGIRSPAAVSRRIPSGENRPYFRVGVIR